MPADGAFYIVTVSGGTVVDKQANGIFDRNADDESPTQHWTAEYGESPDQVAFQNASSGEWLRAFTGAAYGKVDSGEKQWWTLEKGPSPGSCWIKCNDYPNAYLCNANGSYVDRNKVYTWPKQLNWTHALTWHLKDANAPGFNPKEWKSSGSSGAGLLGGGGGLLSAGGDDSAETEKKMKELEAREAALAEREKKFETIESKESALSTREQDLAAKEAEQKKQADQLAAMEKELASRPPPQSSSEDISSEQQALQKKLDELHSAEREIAAKKAASVKREQLGAAKEEELKAKESDLDSKLRNASNNNDDKDAASAKREQLAATRIKELEAKQVELEGKLRDSSNNGVGKDILLKAENEILKLRLRLRELERELEEAKRTGSVGKAGNGSDETEKFQRIKTENERLKNLIAQHFLSKPPKSTSSQEASSTANGFDKQPSDAVNHSGSNATANGVKRPAASKPVAGINHSSNSAQANGVSQPSTLKPSANMSKPVSPPSKTSGIPTEDDKAATNEPTKKLAASKPAKGRAAESPVVTPASKDNTQSSLNKGRVPASSAASGTAATSGKVTNTNSSSPGKASSSAANGSAASGADRQQDKSATTPATTQQKSGSNDLKTPKGGKTDTKRKPSAKLAGQSATAHVKDTPASGKATAGTPRTPNVVSTDGKGKASLKPAGQPGLTQHNKTSPADKDNASKTTSTSIFKAQSADKAGLGNGNEQNGHHQSSASKLVSTLTANGAGSKTGGDGGAKHSSDRVTGGTSDDEDALHFSCGHIAYPLPRKLNRKAVGILYE